MYLINSNAIVVQPVVEVDTSPVKDCRCTFEDTISYIRSNKHGG
jgi:hypothetical protein